jgi:hypothetical protein
VIGTTTVVVYENESDLIGTRHVVTCENDTYMKKSIE